jgi:epoxyqueuosine reductase
VVTLAVSYHGPEPGPGGTLRGVVARYARHSDYHDVLAAPLKALAITMDSLGGPGTRSLWYVDTGPVLERDLAQRAGMAPGFRCARMYRGGLPRLPLDQIYGNTTFELG